MVIRGEGALLKVLDNLLLFEVVDPLALLVLELLDAVLELFQVEPPLPRHALIHHHVEAGIITAS